MLNAVLLASICTLGSAITNDLFKTANGLAPNFGYPRGLNPNAKDINLYSGEGYDNPNALPPWDHYDNCCCEWGK